MFGSGIPSNKWPNVYVKWKFYNLVDGVLNKTKPTGSIQLSLLGFSDCIHWTLVPKSITSKGDFGAGTKPAFSFPYFFQSPLIS